MTDKQIIEQRPICLYQDTCLHLKEKTRLCKDCVHHKNYWSEVLVKDQAEKIKILNQECERLKNENKRLVGELANNVFDGFEQLDQLKAENYKLKKTLKAIKKDIYNIGKLVPIFECETIAKDLQQILEKVEGVEND